RAALEALDGRLHVADARDDDDGGVGIQGAGALEEVEAVHHGHLDVGKDQRRPLALKDLQPLTPVLGEAALIAVREADLAEGAPVLGTVLPDQHLTQNRRLTHRLGASAPTDGVTPASSCTETRFLPARLAT